MSEYRIDWDGLIQTDTEGMIVVPEFIDQLRNPLFSEYLSAHVHIFSDNKIIQYLVTSHIMRNIMQ